MNVFLKLTKIFKKIKLSDRGSVLILAVWTVLFLSVLAVISGTIVRQGILTYKMTEIRDELYRAASSGTVYGIEMVRGYYEESSPNVPDALNGYLFNNMSLKDIAVGENTYSIVYKYTDSITGVVDNRAGFTDENRRININFAGVDVIASLLSKIGGLDKPIAEKLAADIVDWRDKNDVIGEEDIGMSEKEEYINGGLNYSPKNDFFTSFEELLLVKGMTIDVFRRIRDYFTVFGNGKININTVDRDVLVVLGLAPQTADKVIYFRSGLDMKEGTSDDNVFTSVNNIINDIDQGIGLTQNEKEKLTELVFSNILDIKSSAIRSVCISRGVRSELGGKMITVFSKQGVVLYTGYDNFLS